MSPSCLCFWGICCPSYFCQLPHYPFLLGLEKTWCVDPSFGYTWYSISWFPCKSTKIRWRYPWLCVSTCCSSFWKTCCSILPLHFHHILWCLQQGLLRQPSVPATAFTPSFVLPPHLYHIQLRLLQQPDASFTCILVGQCMWSVETMTLSMWCPFNILASLAGAVFYLCFMLVWKSWSRLLLDVIWLSLKMRQKGDVTSSLLSSRPF